MAARNPVDPELPSDREILVTRVVDAPRELVWEAMTDREQVAHWWGPNGFSTTIHEMDVRPGGPWRHTLRGPDGVDYPNHSTFLEVKRPEKLVFDHGGARPGERGVSFRATWTFEAVGAKTKVSMHAVFRTAADRDDVIERFGAVEGGRQTLARLGEYAAKRRGAR